MVTREERRAERVRKTLELGAAQAAARANGQPSTREQRRSLSRNITRQPKKVSVALRERLRKEFGIGCTACFTATLNELDKLSIDEIRSKASEFANSVRENAHEMEAKKGRKDGRTLIKWAKANGGDAAYERLIIEACEACEPSFPSVPAVVSWGNFPQARQWQESHERGDANPDYTHPAKWTYKTTSDLIEATKKIVPQLPHDIMAVAGVPRSGMIPASVLSAWLHIPLFEINPTTGLVQLGHGSRGKHFKVRNDGRVLVVDDTIYRGGAMAHARNRTANVPSIYAATYVRPGQQHRVDVFGEILPSPHLLEWNLLNNGVLTGNAQNKALQGGWAIDFDGVLCHDCPRDGNDTVEGDERYRQWILSAKPKFLSRMIYIPMIVTARPERFRSDTMTWLSQWGVNTKRLVMNQLPSFRERNSSDIPGWKASVLESSDTCGYIESHDLPAQAIHRLWGKPVISLESGTVYQ